MNDQLPLNDNCTSGSNFGNKAKEYNKLISRLKDIKDIINKLGNNFLLK